MFTPRGYARRIDGDLRDVGNRHLEDAALATSDDRKG